MCCVLRVVCFVCCLPDTCQRHHSQYRMQGRRDATVLQFDPFLENDGSGDLLENTGSPLPLERFSIAILGVVVDNMFSLDDRFHHNLTRAQVRRGILAAVARRLWGLDTSVLRITHDSIINSLLSYGWVVSGSCFPEDLLHSAEM